MAGVALADGSTIGCRSVVITTGTFLRGVLHIGSKTRPAGRMPSSLSAKVRCVRKARQWTVLLTSVW